MKKLFALLVVTVAMFITAPAAFATVDVGTTYTGRAFDGSSRTWTFNTGCTQADPVKEIPYVGDSWNDLFFSSRILAQSCTSVKFFQHVNFGGAWFSCDDLCNDMQGDWAIGVSSIKYRRNGGP